MKTIRPILIGVALALSAAGANAQSDSNRLVTLEIKSQILRDALNDWAHQTGFQLISPSSDLMKQVIAPSVTGHLSPRAALEQLLAGTSFTYELLDGRTVVIRERAKTGSSTAGLQRIASATAGEPTTTSDQQGRTTRRAEGNRNIEEIIVTAQKREERLDQVPISISVVAGPDLDRTTDAGVREVLNTIPGVNSTEHYAGGSVIGVRGVSATSPLFDGASPIAYYLDTVPFGFVRTAVAPDANAYDLQRIEVLRGPQGTLYGASALNGVVRVLTADANLKELELKARTSFSSTEEGGDNYRVDGAVNVPIVQDKFAVRAVVGYENMSGWIDRPNRKDANDQELRTGRLKLAGQLTDRFSVDLSAWFTRNDYGASPNSADGKTNPSLIDETSAIDYDIYGLKLTYDLPAVTITSSTSYISYSNVNYLDFSPIGFPATLLTDLSSDLFAEELLLNSNAEGAWRWSVGAFYRDAEDRTFQDLFGPLDDWIDTSKSFAVFGEVTRVFAEGLLDLTAGLRYFEDEVRVKDKMTNPPVNTKDSFDKVSPRVVLTLHPNEQTNAYLSYAEGFRSGALQNPGALSQVPTLPPANADTLHNYEVGMKGNTAGGRLAYELAVYYVDWQDVQQTVSVGSVGFATIVNGGSATGMGVDAALTTQPVDGLQLGLTFSWNDLKSNDVVESGGVVLLETGERLSRSPEYTAGVSGAYSFPMGGGDMTGQVSLSGNYISEQIQRGVFNGEFVSGTSDDLITARAAFSVEANRWGASLFVNNLTNENGVASANTLTPVWDLRLRPRTYGVQVEYRL